MRRIFLFATLFSLASSLMAQDAISYQKPVKELYDVFFAPTPNAVSTDRTYTTMVKLERDAYLTLDDLAQPEYRLAGVRFNPDTYSESRRTGYTAAYFVDMKTLHETKVTGLPEGVIWTLNWYPDYTRMLFQVKTPQGIYLYAASTTDGIAKRLSERQVNACYNDADILWLDDDNFITTMVPLSNQGEPKKNPKPSGPIVQENLGKSTPARTYQDMLKNSYDEDLFEYYFTSQPCKVGPGGTQEIGRPAIYYSISISPDKQYILTAKIQRPFSYTVPAYNFPTRREVCDLNLNVIRTLSETPEIVYAMGYDTTSPYARHYGWRLDQPATLYWIEPQDGGNPKGKKLDYLDAAYQLKAPFDGEKELLVKTPMRLRGIQWSDTDFAVLSMSSRASRQNKICLFTPGNQESVKELFAWSQQDLYADPGQLMTVRNEYDKNVIYTDAKHNEVLFESRGACADGEFPLIYRYNLKTKKKTILWQCQAPYYETVSSYRIEGKKVRFVTSRQSLTEPANFYLHTLGSKKEKQLTTQENPYPSMSGVSKEQIRYKRADGVDLTATVYLPANYNKERDGRLPVLMWAYPREYRSIQEASQVRGSKYRFTRISYGSIVPWVLRGYCIMDAVEMPIVGTKETEPNDNYIEQLVMDAEAAAKVIYDMGVGDTTRIGVGGHSYGAFMTANLMTHTKLFKAGIARSGAYNRSLTPFGFQSETRTYWEAPEVYHNMSPFDYADQLSGALLIIHGELDNNTGTYPIQSERLYQALKGHKATARYVILPLESHGYAARENLEHLIWEEDQWLEKYVKNAGEK